MQVILLPLPITRFSFTGSMKQSFTVIGDMYQRRFPNAIIIGVKKGGTSALRNILKCHPSIQIANNEVVYFSHEDHYKLGMKWYIQHMPLSTKDQLTIEKSPQYFTSTITPKRLFNVSSDAKILLIVRNPLVRAVSDYYFQHRRGNNRSFSGKIGVHGKMNVKVDEIKGSLYNIHYRNWLKWFPKEQILIVDGDNLKVNPIEELSCVEKFLEYSTLPTKRKCFTTTMKLTIIT